MSGEKKEERFLTEFSPIFCDTLLKLTPLIEEETPPTVKRSGSWGKQLRLGNADKPKLDVLLPTDIEDDVTVVDPNRPQFGDWDEPPVCLPAFLPSVLFL